MLQTITRILQGGQMVSLVKLEKYVRSTRRKHMDLGGIALHALLKTPYLLLAEAEHKDQRTTGADHRAKPYNMFDMLKMSANRYMMENDGKALSSMKRHSLFDNHAETFGGAGRFPGHMAALKAGKMERLAVVCMICA